jgi:hypothetical protein
MTAKLFVPSGAPVRFAALATLPLGALIKVTKKHEHISVGEPSLGIWTSLGLRGVAPQMRDQAAYLTLGRGAGGRSLGSI